MFGVAGVMAAWGCYSLCVPVMVTVSLSLAAWLAALTTTRLDLHAWAEQEKGLPRNCVSDLRLAQLAPAAVGLALCTGVLLLHCLPNALEVCCLASRPGAVCSVWHCILCLLSGVRLVQRGRVACVRCKVAIKLRMNDPEELVANGAAVEQRLNKSNPGQLLLPSKQRILSQNCPITSPISSSFLAGRGKVQTVPSPGGFILPCLHSLSGAASSWYSVY